MHKEPIAQFRKAAGLTIKRASELFGVAPKTFHRWERGDPQIPVKRLEDAERILNAKRRDLRPDIFEGA